MSACSVEAMVQSPWQRRLHSRVQTTAAFRSVYEMAVVSHDAFPYGRGSFDHSQSRLEVVENMENVRRIGLVLVFVQWERRNQFNNQVPVRSLTYFVNGIITKGSRNRKISIDHGGEHINYKGSTNRKMRINFGGEHIN
jgi:hypothetical protein